MTTGKYAQKNISKQYWAKFKQALRPPYFFFTSNSRFYRHLQLHSVILNTVKDLKYSKLMYMRFFAMLRMTDIKNLYSLLKVRLRVLNSPLSLCFCWMHLKICVFGGIFRDRKVEECACWIFLLYSMKRRIRGKGNKKN